MNVNINMKYYVIFCIGVLAFFVCWGIGTEYAKHMNDIPFDVTHGDDVLNFDVKPVD